MKRIRFIAATIISILSFQAWPIQSAAYALDSDKIEFQRTNLIIVNEKVLDPFRLNVLDKRLGLLSDPDTLNASMRCKPLKNLNKAGFSLALSTFEGKGYEDLLNNRSSKSNNPDFMSVVRETALNDLKALGIDIGIDSEKYNNSPTITLNLLLVSEDPSFSSITLQLVEKVSPLRTPEQAYLMPTFEIELLGKNTKSGGKIPMELVKSALERFDHWWKFANK